MVFVKLSIFIILILTLSMCAIQRKNQIREAREIEENQKWEATKPEREKRLAEQAKKEGEKEAEEVRNREQLVEKELSKATEKQLYSLIANCQSAIEAFSKEAKKSPYDSFIVDEYSSYKHQAIAELAGGSTETIENRVKRLIKRRKNPNPYPGQYKIDIPLKYELNTKYTIIYTDDSFSGPVRRPVVYNCDILPGLKVKVR